MMQNLLSGGSKAKYAPTAKHIGRKDFNDDDFDFGDSDEEDNNTLSKISMPSVPQTQGYDPKTSILSSLGGAPASQFADPNPSPRSATLQKQNQELANLVNNSRADGVMVIKSSPAPRPLHTIDDDRQLNLAGVEDLHGLQVSKKDAASAQIIAEMKLASEAQEKARTAAYQRRISQQIATDEVKKMNRFIAEAEEAKRKQEEAMEESKIAAKDAEDLLLQAELNKQNALKAIDQSDAEKKRLEQAIVESRIAQERRLEAEQFNTNIQNETNKLKEDLRKAEQMKLVAEKKRLQEIQRAKEAEEDAKKALDERLKMSELKDQVKDEVKQALEEMEAKRRIRMVAEQNAANEMQLAASAAAKSAEEAQKRMEAEKMLKLEAEMAAQLEEEALVEAKRKMEALKSKDCSAKEAEEAEKAAEVAKQNNQRLQMDLKSKEEEAEKAIAKREQAEALKKEAEQKLKEEIDSAAEAERQIQSATEKKLEAIAKSEGEKTALVNIVSEANALVQKRVWAERKLRTEADKAAEAQRKIDLEVQKREAAETRRQTEIKAAKAAEEEAEKEVQRRLDLVKTTDNEKKEIKKALKEAEAHRIVKRKAQEKLKAEKESLKAAEDLAREKEKERLEAEAAAKRTAQETKKAQDELAKQKQELEQLKLNAAKLKQEAREALDEAKTAQQIQEQAAKLHRKEEQNENMRQLTRKQTSQTIEKMSNQLKKQRELQSQKADDDKLLAQVQSQQERLEMVKKEKAALKEHAEALADLERETEMLKQKRLAIEEKRNAENKALQELMLEQRKAAENKNNDGEGKMMKSAGSLYNLLESKKKGGEDGEAGGANGAMGGIMEEEEDELEDSLVDMSSSFKLPSSGICNTCRKKRGDLPIPHFASASGHIDCLTHIVNTDPNSVSTFDKAQRSPLFYSCANGQTLTAVLLIEVFPQTAQLCDSNGDTPLHAAASAGSADLIELLVSRGGSSVNQTNNLGLTASHLAKNRQCLEILFDAGADIYAKCKQRRSPLFVACAMNRLDCAEFICEIIEIEGGSFQEVDKRGDTPLHASACNGSVKCCKLLLDLAVEPGVRNKKGLRPIDLALKRGHSSCEQLLAEFHLHHASTDSNFDSVFFLATLQGHKAMKKGLNEGDKEEVYEIIQNASREEHGVAPVKKQDMERIGSMWSLRKGRSVRLQQWGTWICYEDQNVGTRFWYCQKTKQHSWEMPQEVKVLQEKAFQSATSRWDTLQKTGSMRIKKIGQWIQYTGGMGKTFYFNEKTFEFQWEKPENMGFEEEEGKKGKGKGKGKKEGSGGGSKSNTGAGADDGSVAPKSNAKKSAKPKPSSDKKEIALLMQQKSEILQSWKTYRDPETNMTFYYNEVTQESLWELPPGLAALEEKLRKLVERQGGEEEDDEAAVVDGIDDLGI